MSFVIPTRLLALGAVLGMQPMLPPASPPLDSAISTVEANDNRVPAGELKDGTLELKLVVQMARWYPEASDGPFVDVAAFAEEGKAPQIPAPLIRAPAGTKIVATIRNSLTDSTIWVHGMFARPGANDSMSIAPGKTHTVEFNAGQPGTYLYYATPGKILRRPPPEEGPTSRPGGEREQLSGALVVDAPGAKTDDRIFVLNIWGHAGDSEEYRNALAINGKSWPHTERITSTVGDTLRWRVLNASIRSHPMHLHGFYFRVDSRGTMGTDSVFDATRQRLAVTEDMGARSTMTMAWSPARSGNWLFHCHLVFHVVGNARLEDKADSHEHADPMKHMAGLVIGINVKPKPGLNEDAADATPPRRLHLFAQQKARVGRTPFAMSYVLQRDAKLPAPDSTETPGAIIALNRDQPTLVTIVNRAKQPTSVHWHGIELESYSDGVPGWSGASSKLAPMIAPGDSFTARLSLPRAGTFIYHTHVNDIEQLTSGMYGAVVVLPPNEKFDPSTDHVFVLGWDGSVRPPILRVNGDSASPPLEIARGKKHRLRFVNISPGGRAFFAMRKDSLPVTWTPLAKDGADLPAALRQPRPAIRRLSVGETFDAEFDAVEPGEYWLTVGPPPRQRLYARKVIVR